MKSILVVVSLALAVTAKVPINIGTYHETIGIPEAARIKRAEEAQDFDGSRVVGGQASNLGAHPHAGGVIINLTDGRTSMCGCSLLSSTRIVTAAHCWRTNTIQARLFTVVFGSINIFSGGVRRTTSNLQLHANYNPTNANNDIAIGVIASVIFSNIIQSIRYATGSNNYVDYTATVAGFGRISDSAGSQNQIKRHVNVKVITNVMCRATFGSSSIISSTICTSGAGGMGPCSGDSGGPLTIGSGSNRILVGVVSFGGPFCTVGFPAGYARVTSFSSWIAARL